MLSVKGEHNTDKKCVAQSYELEKTSLKVKIMMKSNGKQNK